MNPLGLAKSVRSLNRLRRIARVLTQHGFGHVVSRLNLGRYASVLELRRPVAAETASPEQVGVRLAAVCNDLGPTFVKLGQLLTTRPDLLPEDVLAGLRTLQDQAEPFDSETAMRIIEEDLGADPRTCFSSIDATPLASGSIGQVYHATAADGLEVVVKVMRPDIADSIRLDMHLLKWLADALERYLPEVRAFKPVLLVEEFEDAILREMDYVNEAASTARFCAAFAEVEHVCAPQVRWDLCGPRVLTLERVAGRNLDTVLRSGDADLDRKLLADRLANAYLKQFFEMGVFHADPHAGNILITPPARIALIDFGQVGTISDELAHQLTVLLFAGIGREIDLVVDTLGDMQTLGPQVDRTQLARALRRLLNKYYGLPLNRVDHRLFFSEVSEIFRQFDVTVPRDAVVLCKALATIAGVAMQLDPEIDLVSILKPRLKRMVAERLAPRRLLRGLGISGWHLFSILRTAPRQLRTALQRVSLGQWQLTVRHENLERLTSEMDRSSNRLATSIVIAAIIVGSSVVVSTDRAVTFFDIPVQFFGIIGYLFAGVMGLALLWAIFRSGRLS
ncbi:MAG: AarF/ABC1/UbiB kinase family protein [bacterium]|nr:AarF/ABC1/UbiB kinase family protein [bacterium]